MKTTLFVGMLLAVALLIAGCGKTPPAGAPAPQATHETVPSPQEAAPPLPMRTESPEATGPSGSRESAEDAKVAAHPKESPAQEKAAEQSPGARSKDKPSVLKAVGRSLLKSFTSGSEQEQRSDAPAFRPNR